MVGVRSSAIYGKLCNIIRTNKKLHWIRWAHFALEFHARQSDYISLVWSERKIRLNKSSNKRLTYLIMTHWTQNTLSRNPWSWRIEANINKWKKKQLFFLLLRAAVDNLNIVLLFVLYIHFHDKAIHYICADCWHTNHSHRECVRACVSMPCAYDVGMQWYRLLIDDEAFIGLTSALAVTVGRFCAGKFWASHKCGQQKLYLLMVKLVCFYARNTILSNRVSNHILFILFFFLFRLFCFDLVSFKTFVYNNNRGKKNAHTHSHNWRFPPELLVFIFVRFDTATISTQRQQCRGRATRIYVCLLRRSNCVAAGIRQVSRSMYIHFVLLRLRHHAVSLVH